MQLYQLNHLGFHLDGFLFFPLDDITNVFHEMPVDVKIEYDQAKLVAGKQLESLGNYDAIWAKINITNINTFNSENQ